MAFMKNKKVKEILPPSINVFIYWKNIQMTPAFKNTQECRPKCMSVHYVNTNMQIALTDFQASIWSKI